MGVAYLVVEVSGLERRSLTMDMKGPRNVLTWSLAGWCGRMLEGGINFNGWESSQGEHDYA
jgi:hypothetical protein